MQQKRKIAVLTSSRADYGHLYWPLTHLSENPHCDLRIITFAAHLSHEFGHTYQQIIEDGFVIEDHIECLLSSDTDIGMAKTIGLATLGLADALGKLRPDILLLIADRYEMMAPASVATALRIPIAHIEGGDVSEGAIDDAVRNALTKLSHIHLTPTETAKKRVLAMGEEPWRVHCTGTPSLDHLVHSKLISQSELEGQLNTRIAGKCIIVAYHPVTLYKDSLKEADALFQALANIQQQIIFCFPNADTGSRVLISRARAFCEQRDNSHLFINLQAKIYWSLLKYASLLLGNSSSGIMETASIPLPTVNIGIRQQGRERSLNVIDTPADSGLIQQAVNKALQRDFAASLNGLINPYGDGYAGQRIAEILMAAPLGESLLHKKALPLVSVVSPGDSNIVHGFNPHG